jgi:FHS family L-fucose permease-like MFS transporter
MMMAAPTPSDTTRPEVPLLPSGVLRPFVLVTGLFFLWGLPNNLNDVLIRQFMKSFAINRFQAGLVQSSFYLGYFLLAMPAGILIKQRGYKAGILTGLACFALGCFLFWPAAISRPRPTHSSHSLARRELRNDVSIFRRHSIPLAPSAAC